MKEKLRYVAEQEQRSDREFAWNECDQNDCDEGRCLSYSQHLSVSKPVADES